jgi:hypothetical protein
MDLRDGKHVETSPRSRTDHIVVRPTTDPVLPRKRVTGPDVVRQQSVDVHLGDIAGMMSPA